MRWRDKSFDFPRQTHAGPCTIMHNLMYTTVLCIGVWDVIKIPDSVLPGTHGVIKTRLSLDVHKVYYIDTYYTWLYMYAHRGRSQIDRIDRAPSAYDFHAACQKIISTYYYLGTISRYLNITRATASSDRRGAQSSLTDVYDV